MFVMRTCRKALILHSSCTNRSAIALITCGLPQFTTHVGGMSQSVDSSGRPLVARPGDARYLDSTFNAQYRL
jgi:hypothetical protein